MIEGGKYMKKIIKIQPLSMPWQTIDPFIITMHHKDDFPKGTDAMGPVTASLAGRRIGNDFSYKDGWSMYHGETVPGFPAHPHRGFETITFVIEGYVDHSDSRGTQGRYGKGDVQWMTAGKGMQHAEMFPLLNKDNGNPMELFQIWLNLPAKDKLVEPNYKMLWSEDIPVVNYKDEAGKETKVTLVAGSYNKVRSLSAAPDSWANKDGNHVGIWQIQMEPQSIFQIPKVSSTLNRTLYYYEGGSVSIEDTLIQANNMITLAGDENIVIQNGNERSSFILLEGEPIGEPVVEYGPFVMNTQQEIEDAYKDFQDTKFGGWPWDSYDPMIPRGKQRFALHEDGRLENKE
jgi:redox-sensitive bicupin YhaK (pirin superfamily)